MHAPNLLEVSEASGKLKISTSSFCLKPNCCFSAFWGPGRLCTVCFFNILRRLYDASRRQTFEKQNWLFFFWPSSGLRMLPASCKVWTCSSWLSEGPLNATRAQLWSQSEDLAAKIRMFDYPCNSISTGGLGTNSPMDLESSPVQTHINLCANSHKFACIFPELIHILSKFLDYKQCWDFFGDSGRKDLNQKTGMEKWVDTFFPSENNSPMLLFKPFEERSWFPSTIRPSWKF